MTLHPLTAGLRPGGLGVGGSLPVTYTSRLIAAGATGIWPMQEASGNALDVSGQGNDMLANGVLTYRQAGPGGSLQYAMTGWAAAVYLASAAVAFRATGAFTAGLWFNIPLIGTVCTPINRDNGSTTRVWFAGFNVLALTPWAARLVPTVTDVIGGSPNANATWLFLAVRYTPSTEWAVFRNGAKDGFNTTSIPAALANNTVPLRLGSLGSGGLIATNARIAGAFWAPSALSDATLLALYNAGTPE